MFGHLPDILIILMKRQCSQIHICALDGYTSQSLIYKITHSGALWITRQYSTLNSERISLLVFFAAATSCLLLGAVRLLHTKPGGIFCFLPIREISPFLIMAWKYLFNYVGAPGVYSYLPSTLSWLVVFFCFEFSNLRFPYPRAHPLLVTT